MNLGTEGIAQALRSLNAKLVYAEMPPLNLVVCGGAALVSLGLIGRSTSDVDVIGSLPFNATGEAISSVKDALPDELLELVREIGIESGIRPDWLNPGPSLLIEFGLPEGLETRLKEISFGNCLKVSFVGRFDLIHLKIFAAMDATSDSVRHLSDLLDLEPSEDEASAAVDWLLRRDSSDAFKRKLRQVLDRIGHERIGEKI